MEITCHDHSIIACLRYIYMGVILCSHPIRGESHIQPNANREVTTMANADWILWFMMFWHNYRLQWVTARDIDNSSQVTKFCYKNYCEHFYLPKWKKCLSYRTTYVFIIQNFTKCHCLQIRSIQTFNSSPGTYCLDCQLQCSFFQTSRSLLTTL